MSTTEDKFTVPKTEGEQERLALAQKLGMEVLAESPLIVISQEIFQKIPYPFVKKHLLIPIKEESGTLVIATADPLNLDGLEELRLMLDTPLKAIYTSSSLLLKIIHDCYHQKETAASEFIATLSDSQSKDRNEDVEVYDLLDNKEQAPIIRMLNLILSEAIQQGASDIHFEPFENDLKIRYRIDGVLQNRHAPASETQAQLLTRIKVMAKLDIAEHRLPQDGRIKLKMGGREIDFRVSTVPVSHGERIVLRILDKGNVVLGIDKLGMLPTMMDEFKRLLSLSEGIILVTGPTGSGKTTTLYSAICDLYNEEINIMTIEDPVEYKLKGIAQIGVHPKINLDFATGLRHILRQDPDVVMIGEIRDEETANIAIQASLTGHLVLSTLHTNDAPSTITRLVDMGVEAYLLSSSVVGILAQRLVRRVCPHCRVGYEPTDTELKEIGLQRDELMGGQLYRGTGCDQCFNSGYKGRHAIYELLTIDDILKTQIAKNANAVELRQIALKNGFTTLKQHGAHLVRTGISTIAEVLKASSR